MASLLAMSGEQHSLLRSHLLPADGREAAAILLCTPGVAAGRLFVRNVLPIPYAECGLRRRDAIVWPGARLVEAQARAEDEDLSIVLAHSHPGGLFAFSGTDDASDETVIGSLFSGWCGTPPALLGSAVMVPGGAMRARVYSADGARSDVDCVRVAGDGILHFAPDGGGAQRPPMAFGDAMRDGLSRRRACVIGVSGTGSIVAEQVARLGFGGVVLIDFDVVERRNLNRILNSTVADAEALRPKVEMFAAAIAGHRPDADVVELRESILSRAAVEAAAGCDVVFSCVDTAEGRQIADLVAQAFLIPLIDMGVTIPTRRTAGGGVAIAEALGRIDYVQPGGSTLASRGVFTAATLRAEYLARVDPEAHAAEMREGYIRGAHEEAPSVLPLNMRAASAAVIEYLARSFPFRHDSDAGYARTLFRLAEGDEERFAEASFERGACHLLGTGAAEPLLGLPELGRPC